MESMVARHSFPKRNSSEATTNERQEVFPENDFRDEKKNSTPTQVYIQSHHRKHYVIHHQTLKADDKTKLLNGRNPSECPSCGSKDFMRYGFKCNGIKVYKKCRSCNRKFTVLSDTIFDGHRIPISEWIEFASTTEIPGWQGTTRPGLLETSHSETDRTSLPILRN
jgi:hypothetical protein